MILSLVLNSTQQQTKRDSYTTEKMSFFSLHHSICKSTSINQSTILAIKVISRELTIKTQMRFVICISALSLKRPHDWKFTLTRTSEDEKIRLNDAVESIVCYIRRWQRYKRIFNRYIRVDNYSHIKTFLCNSAVPLDPRLAIYSDKYNIVIWKEKRNSKEIV